MKLLVLTTVVPFPPTNGMAMRSGSVLSALRSLGHELHLLALDDKEVPSQCVPNWCKSATVVPHRFPSATERGAYIRRLRALPHFLPYATLTCRSPKAQAAVRDICLRKAIDVLWCETLDARLNVPDDLDLPVVINTQNVEYFILMRYLQHESNILRYLYALLECRKLKNWERRAYSGAHLVLACSQHDKDRLQELCPTALIEVVPNAVDTATYSPRATAIKERTVLYTGGMDWYPNRDAVEYFAFQILPRLRQLIPAVRFIVAGRNPSPDFRAKLEAQPGVHFTGTVPDMTPVIAEAAVCVVPLRIGSGTRLKILEAAAMAKPIVSTHVGAEGLSFVDGEEIILTDEPGAFAAATAELLRDPERRRTFGRAARLRVEREYSFESMTTSLARCLPPGLH